MTLSVNSCGSTIAEGSCCSLSTAGRHSRKHRAVWHGLGNAGSNIPCAPLHHYHQDCNSEPTGGEKMEQGGLAKLMSLLRRR